MAPLAGGEAQIFGFFQCNIIGIDHVAAIGMGVILLAALGGNPYHGAAGVGIVRIAFPAGGAGSVGVIMGRGRAAGLLAFGAGLWCGAGGLLPVVSGGLAVGFLA